jgi:hypothetical protein
MPFRVTYDIVTEESAENGESAECGFVRPDGGHDPVYPKDRGKIAEMDLRTALRHCQPQYDCGSWFGQEGQVEDYSTDKIVSYSLHPPRTITPSSYARLARLLKVR